MINLYGECIHGDDIVYERKLELIKRHYKDGIRHIFIESPYYSAQFLNIWMKSNDDKILEEIYEDLQGTAVYNSK